LWAYFPAVLVAALGVAITIAALVLSLNWEKSQVKIEFREASQDRILVAQRGLQNAFRRVEDVASFFEASPTVGRREFRKFVGPALKNDPEIKALAWVPVVLNEGLPAFLETVRQSFPPFEITEIGAEGEPVKSDDRPVYYPVVYVQPYQANKELLGLDMGVDPVVSPLLREAELARVMQVSPGASIVNDTGEKEQVIVVVPVYDDDETLEEFGPQPRPGTRGFSIGIFYVGDIIENTLKTLRSAGVDIRFYQVEEGADRRQLLYSHRSRLREGVALASEPSELAHSEPISVGNWQWEVVCTPAPGRFETDVWYSWIILAGGIAFTVLLTVYLTTLIGRARQVRQEVELRTSQLWQTVQALNREVTERKSAERELQSLNETLEHHIRSRTAEADRRAQYLEQFAYVTSHDLKAPLRAVSNLAGWIEEDLADKLDESSKEQLALLRDRVRRMHNLIEGLLEYSRVGRASDTKSRVDTLELVNEIIDSLSPPKGFKIKIQGEMPTLNADRLQLGQVFANLISNGLKHHGGDKGRIWITGKSSGDVCEFSVCDNGQGIAPEYHGKVFMMFQTLGSSDYESSTGIGLALVKKIVEEHGGTIRLESTLGEGACFLFTWPNEASS
jgi:signal transduction histidine kinase